MTRPSRESSVGRKSSVPHLCAMPLGARVGNHNPYPVFRSFIHKTRVPHPRDVFVFVARVGDHEPHLAGFDPKAVQ
jgi:hypothetical protein